MRMILILYAKLGIYNIQPTYLAALCTFLGVATLAVAFGLAVRAARNRRHWRQEDLAQAASVKRSYISLIEQGRVEPGLSIQERLAAALGVPLSELVADAEQERERHRRRQGAR